MRYDLVLLNTVLIPVAGAFILPLVARISLKTRDFAALGLVLASFVFSLLLIPQIMAGRAVIIFSQLPLGFNFVLTADALAVFMACVSSFISAIIILYSFGYISHYENQNEYYTMVVLFLGAMMGLVFAGNLILLYVFWEITAITSWRLIGFFREKKHVICADKAFLVTMFGAVLMLIGFISIFQQTGSFDLAVIKESVKTNPVSNLAIALILVGIFSKSATLPFHTWLPDAGVAPSPVTALLHAAILVKIGVYVFARLFLTTFSLAQFWHTAVPIIAAISAIVSAGAALRETDIKRIIAYSTVSQIGFIFLGLSIGNELAVAGGLLYILMHGLAKAGLFLCAGIIEQNTKTKDITKLGGLIKTMPVTAMAFLFCAFSVMGIPPFGGFFSKYMVFAGAVETGHLWIVFAFLVGAFLTILYLFRVFNLVFLGEARSLIQAKEKSPIMVTSVAILAVLSLVGGIFINYPCGFVQIILANMAGIIK
ncbi:MAG: NADH-quinone oxidoreductase subunit L [Candidatus Omnitrophica bacterium]|nr:NADH-quinone oxidoreductase subunit L [Candidatus Omnitrophota bacterium]MDD5352095.1 NADH-quinone oxidoreductase subunit L [Candidatus Omnitrophota bacterium]MDD5549693.1 NADH-quinone oxidoreductase subunit L [Candidatus Omnitrophota bacterium]